MPPPGKEQSHGLGELAKVQACACTCLEQQQDQCCRGEGGAAGVPGEAAGGAAQHQELSMCFGQG